MTKGCEKTSIQKQKINKKRGKEKKKILGRAVQENIRDSKKNTFLVY